MLVDLNRSITSLPLHLSLDFLEILDEPVLCLDSSFCVVFSNSSYKSLMARLGSEVECELLDNLRVRIAKSAHGYAEKQGRLAFVVNDFEVGISFLNGLFLAKLSEKTQSKEQLIRKVLEELNIPAFVSTLNSGVMISDHEARIIYVNKVLCELFNLGDFADSIIGTDCVNAASHCKNMFMLPDDFVNRIQFIMSEKQMVVNEVLELSNGCFYERDYWPFKIDDKTYHIWNYKNATQKIASQRELTVSENKYRSLIAGVNIGLMEVDNNECIVFVNDCFSSIVGYDYKDLIGKKASKILLSEEAEEIMNSKIHERLEGISDVYEIPFLHKSGQTKWLLISGGPLYNYRNEVIGSVGLMLDITERKLMEIDLKKTNFELDHFVYRASHDMRAPLRSILGILNLFDIEQDVTAHEHYKTLIRKMITKLDGFIADLTTYSRNSRQVLDNQVVDVVTIIDESVESLQYMENANRLEIKAEYLIESELWSDKSRLSTIVMNMLSNAIKYQDLSKDNSYLKIKVAIKKSCLVILFEDNGVGILEEYVDKVFDMFFRASDSNYGSGLGLYITAEIIQKMKGFVKVKSLLGSGTKFKVILPNMTSSNDFDEMLSIIAEDF